MGPGQDPRPLKQPGVWSKFFFSRKFIAASLSVGMIFLGGIVGIWATPFRELYSTFVTGVVGIFTAYSGANVVSGMIAGRQSNQSNQTIKGMVVRRTPPDLQSYEDPD